MLHNHQTIPTVQHVAVGDTVFSYILTPEQPSFAICYWFDDRGNLQSDTFSNPTDYLADIMAVQTLAAIVMPERAN